VKEESERGEREEREKERERAREKVREESNRHGVGIHRHTHKETHTHKGVFGGGDVAIFVLRNDRVSAQAAGRLQSPESGLI
jgi:hypothetical protein